MSRVETVMDGVLTQLTDGILTSATQLRGYLGHELIQQAQNFPHVQVFNPVVGSDTDPFRQAPETLEFQLEILDAPGRADENRTVLEALAVELQSDTVYANSLGADRIQVELRALQERTENEISVAGARLLVDFPQYGRTPGEVDLFTMPGNASLFDSRGGGTETVTNSELIPGGIGLQRVLIGVQNILRFIEPVFPLDLSALTRIRLLYYIRHSNVFDEGGLISTELRLTGGDVSVYQISDVGAGWKEHVITLDEPTSGSADLSAITQVEWTRRVEDSLLLQDEESMVLMRLYFRPDDQIEAPAVVEASRAVEAMQFVLDRLEQSNYGATRQRGYLDPIHIQEASGLPFVQVFQAETVDEAATFGDRPSALSFVVQIIDLPGQADSIRDALENLTQSLREDPELDRSFRVTAHSVDEREDRDTAIGAATIEVTWQDEVLALGDTTIIDLVGNASGMRPPSQTFVDSEIIERAIGQIKTGSGVADMELESPGFSEFPLDVSGLRFLRFLFYQRETSIFDSGGTGSFRIQLLSPSNTDEWFVPLNGTGWLDFALDLANPDVNGGADHSDIIRIRIQRFYLDSTRIESVENFLIVRVYHHATDLIGTPLVLGTTGSRTEIYMQAVLDHVADEMLGGVPKLRGFRRHESIEGSGPFVMVYSGITDTTANTYGERSPSLDFTLDILDDPGRGDAMRDLFQQLAADLRQSIGLITAPPRARLALRSVSEKATRERTFGRATISLDWNASDKTHQETDVIALAGNAAFVFSGVNDDLISNSEVIEGGIAYDKRTFASTVTLIFTQNFPEFPVDLTAAVFLRVVMYVRENWAVDGGVQNFYTFRLRDTSNNENQYDVRGIGRSTGWHEAVIDLRNPVSGVANLALVNDFRFVFATETFELTDAEAFIVKRFYFTDRDTGSNPNGRSF